MKRTTALIVALALSGCGGEATLDATSDATAKASVERMVGGLPGAQGKEFMRSVVVLTLRGATKGFREHSLGTGTGTADALKPYHGMTVSQLNAKAAEFRASSRPRP